MDYISSLKVLQNRKASADSGMNRILGFARKFADECGIDSRLKESYPHLDKNNRIFMAFEKRSFESNLPRGIDVPERSDIFVEIFPDGKRVMVTLLPSGRDYLKAAPRADFYLSAEDSENYGDFRKDFYKGLKETLEKLTERYMGDSPVKAVRNRKASEENNRPAFVQRFRKSFRQGLNSRYSRKEASFGRNIKSSAMIESLEDIYDYMVGKDTEWAYYLYDEYYGDDPRCVIEFGDTLTYTTPEMKESGEMVPRFEISCRIDDEGHFDMSIVDESRGGYRGFEIFGKSMAYFGRDFDSFHKEYWDFFHKKGMQSLKKYVQDRYGKGGEWFSMRTRKREKNRHH